MKDARRESGISLSAPEDIDEMIHCSRPSRGDHWNAHGITDGGCQLAIKSCSHPIGVHGGEQDLAGTAGFSLARPLNNAAACGLTAALHENLRIANGIGSIRIAARVNGYDDGLRAKTTTYGVN
jgi:hypothetical protein